MKKITLFLLLASLIGAEEVQEDIEIDPFEKMNRVVFNISDSIDQNFTLNSYSNVLQGWIIMNSNKWHACLGLDEEKPETNRWHACPSSCKMK